MTRRIQILLAVILTAVSVIIVLFTLPAFAETHKCESAGVWAGNDSYIYTVECQEGGLNIVKWLHTEPVAIYSIDADNNFEVAFSKFDDEPVAIHVREVEMTALFELESGLILESKLQQIVGD